MSAHAMTTSLPPDANELVWEGTGSPCSSLTIKSFGSPDTFIVATSFRLIEIGLKIRSGNSFSWNFIVSKARSIENNAEFEMRASWREDHSSCFIRWSSPASKWQPGMPSWKQQRKTRQIDFEISWPG